MDSIYLSIYLSIMRMVMMKNLVWTLFLTCFLFGCGSNPLQRIRRDKRSGDTVIGIADLGIVVTSMNLAEKSHESLEGETYKTATLEFEAPNKGADYYLWKASLNGKKDIVVNNYLPKEKYGESIIWYRVPTNPKKDKWQALLIADRTAPGGVHYMSMGDIDGDGVEEFLAGAKGENFKNGNWFAYWERGNDVNKPWERVTIPGSYEGATHIYPADVNMDGKMDLVTSQGHDKGILWFEGPDFKAHKIDEKLIHPHAMQVADMDNDGDIDVVACANYSAKAQWFENDGKGNFTRHHLLDNQKSYDITISDLNNDGLLDLIIAGWKGGNVMILINN